MALEYPDDLKYLDSHEYVRCEGEIATIGISAFAIEQLGDIVFLELPEVGDSIEKEGSFGSVESVKAVEDLKSPLTGTIVERNEEILESPERLSEEDPYIEGWLIKVQVKDPAELEGDDIFSAEQYREMVKGE